MGLLQGLNNLSIKFGFGKFPFFSQRGIQQSFLLGQKQAIWLDMNNLQEVYESIPELRLVINRKASMFANGRFSVVNKDGEVIDNHKALAVLNNPNPLQSRNEWLMQHKVSEGIFGTALIFGLKPTSLSTMPSVLWNLPSQHMRIKVTGNIYHQSDIDGIIEGYELIAGGVKQAFETKEVLLRNMTNVDNPIDGRSPFFSLVKPISNIEGAYQSRNVLINERGALGILSNASKDGDGGLPLDPIEKKKIEEEHLQRYGIQEGKSRIILTEASLNWQPMSFPTKDLQLFEEVEEDFKKIIDQYGLHINIFSSKDGAKFENVRQSEILVYQDTIIPEANDLGWALTKFFGMDPDKERIVITYDHLPLLQENEKQRAEVRDKTANAIAKIKVAEVLDPTELTEITRLWLGIDDRSNS